MSEVEQAAAEIDNNAQPKTPKATPSKRLTSFERARVEGEELLKALGGSLEGGRRTRSSTRPAQPPPVAVSPPTKKSRSSTPRKGKKKQENNVQPISDDNHNENNVNEEKANDAIDGDESQSEVVSPISEPKSENVNQSQIETDKMEVDAPKEPEEVKQSEACAISEVPAPAEVPKDESSVPVTTESTNDVVVSSQPVKDEPKVAQVSTIENNTETIVVETNKTENEIAPSEKPVKVIESPISEAALTAPPTAAALEVKAPVIEVKAASEPLNNVPPQIVEPPTSVPTITIDTVNDTETKTDKTVTVDNEPTVKTTPEEAVSSA